MRMYCADCDTYFDEDELKTRQECMGEFWGSPAYETFACCPHCGSDESLFREDDVDFPREDDEDEEEEDE